MYNAADLDELLLEHAGLTASVNNKNQLRLKGVIQIKKQWFTISLLTPQFPTIQDMHCEVLEKHEMRSLPMNTTEINPKWSVSEFLQHYLPTLKQSSDKETICASAPLYGEIAEVYEPQAYKLFVNNDYSIVRFSDFVDFEQHYLELALPLRQVLQHSLPNGLPWTEMLHKCVNLKTVVQQFQNYLEKLRDFYNNLQDFDELTHVLQPSPVTTKHNYRIFLMRKRVFLKLHIDDPFSPATSMLLHIMGPSYEVEELRSIYSRGLKHWDTEMDIYQNLLRIFDLCFFPLPEPDQESTEQSENCCICFDYHNENRDVPLITCDNKQCTMIFHAACLKKWFNASTDGKTFLNVSIGHCLTCKTKLSTSFAELFLD